MTIKTTQANYVSHISDDSLKEILEYYWKNKFNQGISIEGIQYETGGSYKDGVLTTGLDSLTIRFKDKNRIT